MSLFSNLRLTIVKKLGIVVINLALFNLRIGNWSLGLNDWFWIHYRRNSIRSLYDFCVHFLFLVSYQVCLLSAFLRKMSLYSHLRLTIVKRLGIIVIDLAFFTLRIGNWSLGLNDWFWIHFKSHQRFRGNDWYFYKIYCYSFEKTRLIFHFIYFSFLSIIGIKNVKKMKIF